MAETTKRVRLDDAENVANMEEDGETRVIQGLPPRPNVTLPEMPYQALPRDPTDLNKNWVFSNRTEMQEIVPSLFLGPFGAASKSQLANLKAAGITHIICIRHIRHRDIVKPSHRDAFVYLEMEIGDDPSTLLLPYVRRSNQFIEGVLQNGGKVLVHGLNGISASAALVAAYIMKTFGIGVTEALAHIRTQRLAACPSEWLFLQLKEYELIFQAEHDSMNAVVPEGAADTAQAQRTNKRGNDCISTDDDEYDMEEA